MARRETKGTATHCGFTLEKELGKGAYGSVYKAVRTDERGKRKHAIALKVPRGAKPDEDTSHGIIKESLMEAILSMALKHPNIIRSEYVARDCDQRHKVVIGLELAKESLSHVIKKIRSGERIVDMTTRVRWLYEIWCALSHLHYNGVAHIDIKPGNILLVEEKEGTSRKKKTREVAKVTDFGLSERLLVNVPTYLGGTPEYEPPERQCPQRIHRKYAIAADIWAFGVTAFETLFLMHPFKRKSKKDSSSSSSDSGSDRASATMAEIVGTLPPPPQDWLTEFPSCGKYIAELDPKTVKPKKGNSVFERLFRGPRTAAYKAARAYYQPAVLFEQLETFFENIFQWMPADRKVDFTDLLTTTKLIDQLICPPPTYQFEDRKSPPTWMKLVRRSVPDKLMDKAFEIWKRLQCVEAESRNRSSPTPVDMLAILSLVAKMNMQERSDQIYFDAVLPKRMRPTDISVYDRQYEIIDLLGFNFDAFPSPCPAKPRSSPSPKPRVKKQPVAKRHTPTRPRETVRSLTTARNLDEFCDLYRRDPSVDISSLRLPPTSADGDGTEEVLAGRRLTRSLLNKLCPL